MDERGKLVLAELKPSDSVLDVGCVNHNISSIDKENWLHGIICKKCPDTLGIDIESDAIKRLTEMGYNVRQVNCEQLNLGSAFDVIVAGELVEHLSNPGLFLEGVKKHLKPNGKFILSVPNVYCYYNILSAVFRRKVPVHEQHKCWYDRTTIKQLLQAHGFQIVRFGFLPIPSTGRGRLLSLFLYYLGFKNLSAAGFLLICKLQG